MGKLLRAKNHDFSLHQFGALALEPAQIGHLVVLGSRPQSDPGLGDLHADSSGRIVTLLASNLKALAGHLFFQVGVALALTFGSLFEGAAFHPGEAVHAVGGDLSEDLVDAVLLRALVGLAFLGAFDGALVDLATFGAVGVVVEEAGAIVDAVLLLESPGSLGAHHQPSLITEIKAVRRDGDQREAVPAA